MVGDVEDACGEVPVFAEAMAGGYVEGGVHRQVVALVGAGASAGQAVGKSNRPVDGSRNFSDGGFSGYWIQSNRA